MPSEYLRVKDKTSGHEYTIPAARFDDDAHERLDKPALGNDGAPAPVKYRTELGTPLPGSKQARKKAAAKSAAGTTKTPPAAEPGNSDGQSAGTAEEN